MQLEKIKVQIITIIIITICNCLKFFLQVNIMVGFSFEFIGLIYFLKYGMRIV